MYAFPNDILSKIIKLNIKFIVFNHFVDFILTSRVLWPDVTEHVEIGHSRLNNRTYLIIAKEYLTCVIKPVKFHDNAYLLCLMTVKVISLLNFMCQHTRVCILDCTCDPNLTKWVFHTNIRLTSTVHIWCHSPRIFTQLFICRNFKIEIL